MTITTFNNDNTSTTYHFDPAGYEEISRFYNRLMREGSIQYYTVLV